MWTSGALSVFNDNWADNFIEDPEQPPGQWTGGGQVSPGGTEYLNLPDGEVLTGTATTPSHRQSQTSTANSNTNRFSPYNRDAGLLRSINPQHVLPSQPDPNNVVPTDIEGTQTNPIQDFDMGTAMDLSSFAWPFDTSTQSQTDPANFPNQDTLMDFDLQQYIAQDPTLFQQQPSSSFAPLSPALTPPPSSLFQTPESSTALSTTSSTRPDFQRPTFETDEQRWEATLARSHAADRSFLYGVTTTKIFCRPSCPSRRATRKNIEFFPFPGAIEAAQSADFRPCKRCKPETIGTADAGVLGVIKVLGVIIKDAEFPFSPIETCTKLETLALAGGLSAFHFHRLFKSTTKLTPGELIAACRSLALGDALGMDNKKKAQSPRQSGRSDRVGEEDPSPSAATRIANSTKWNPRTARKALGSVSPTDYAAGCRSLKIHRVAVDTAEGLACIAYSPHRGDVLTVIIGEDAKERVGVRFPGSEASAAHASELEKCVRELQEAGLDREADIPEDLRGWLWRARVWVRVVRDGYLKDNEG